MKRKLNGTAFFPLFVLLLPLLLTGCQRNREPVSQTGFYFNTVISITLYDASDPTILEDAFALCQTYETMLSRTVEGSDVYRINHSEGKPVAVSEETAGLIREALSFSRLTDGRIDLTVAPLMDLWNFTGDTDTPKQPPDASDIEALLPHVNYRFVTLEGNVVTLSDPETQIDLGFIAKGYIADQLKSFLLERGVQSALIDLGGNVLTVGAKPDGQPFIIGVQEPFAPRGTVLTRLPVTDTSLVSSGTYERYFEADGVLYHHILDPATGYPANTGLQGVTILSSSSMQGDGLSTTCLLLGLEKGMELIESTPGVEAIFIDDNHQIYRTSGLEE